MARVAPKSSKEEPLPSEPGSSNDDVGGGVDVLEEAQAVLGMHEAEAAIGTPTELPVSRSAEERLAASQLGVEIGKRNHATARSSASMRSSRKSIVRVETDDDDTFEPLDAMMKELERSGADISGLPDTSTMRKDVKRLNRRLRRGTACLLNPRSNMMQRWDFCTLSALFFTATVTPYEVCMMWGDTKQDTLFYVNQFVNGIFVVDIIFNFLLPYRESLQKGGGTVKSHYKIAKKYIRSWFFLDVISVIPVDVLMVYGLLGGSAEVDGDAPSGAGATDLLQMIRMLRLLRLIKLARILRASRIFSRWENSISISYARQTLIKWTVTIAIVLHWMSCSLGLLAQLHESLRTLAVTDEIERRVTLERAGQGWGGGTECYGCVYGDYGDEVGMRQYCLSGCLTPCELDARAATDLPNAFEAEISAHLTWLAKQESWVCRYQGVGTVRPPEWHGEVWVTAVYVSLIQLGGGVGSIVPENLAEYILFVINILLGSLAWAMVVGTICGIMATGDPHTIAFQHNMDGLNFFLRDMSMPTDLCIRAREYLRNTRDLAKRSNYNELIEQLSPSLRADVVLHMSRQLMETVWYIAELENGALVELALKLHRSGFAPKEKVSAQKLNILMRGVAAKSGNILTYGQHWGEDIIVSAPALRDMRPASALTYVEVATLSRADLFEVLERFPASHQPIRQAAMRIAMRRAVVILSEYVRARTLKKASGSALRGEMLAAFGAETSSSDPTSILRVITGKNRKDIDEEGYLVEEVDLPDPEGVDKAVKLLEDSGTERMEMRRELASVKNDVGELKKMMQMLLDRSQR